MKTEELDILSKISEEGKISHAYILNVDNTYNSSIVKKIVSNFLIKNNPEVDKKYIETMIESETFSDFKIIRPDGKNIKKEQIKDLMFEFNNKSLNDNYRFYVIEFVEDLNLFSANSLLKFLEEPEEKIIAILVTKNINKILPTIVSRCQIININHYENNTLDENKKEHKNILFNILQNNTNSIAYLNKLYQLKASDLIEIFTSIYYLGGEIITNKYDNNENEDLSINVENLTNVMKNIEIGINFLYNNVNPRIVLDYIFLGGEYIDESKIY